MKWLTPRILDTVRDDVAVESADRSAHNDHRSHADDDPDQRQEGPKLLGVDGLQGDSCRVGEEGNRSASYLRPNTITDDGKKSFIQTRLQRLAKSGIRQSINLSRTREYLLCYGDLGSSVSA